MYYKDELRERYSPIIDEIQNNTSRLDRAIEEVKIEAQSIDTGIDQTNSSIDKLISAVDDLNSSNSQLLDSLIIETKKTNALLKRFLQVEDGNLPEDFSQLICKNIIFAHSSYKKVKDYVSQMAKATESNVIEINEQLTPCDLATLLSNAKKYDYILIDNNYLTEDSTRMFINSINTNTISFWVGQGINRRELNLKMQPLNFVIYTDLLDFVNPQLQEIMEIVK